MIAQAHPAQVFCRLILVQHPFLLFPDIELIFADGKENRNIFFCNNMSLAENSIFCDAADNLCDVVTQDRSLCIDGFNQFHSYPLPKHVEAPVRCDTCIFSL